MATLLKAISTIAIVGALIFTGLRVRTANRTRADQTAMTMIQTTQRQQLVGSLELIASLPENAELALVDEAGKATAAALSTLNIRLETIGYMVLTIPNLRHSLETGLTRARPCGDPVRGTG